MINGSCLCGKVKYEIRSGIDAITHCHCQSCRKAHATAFSSVARINRKDFKLTCGKNGLSEFQSSPGKTRYFCSTCGSQIYTAKDSQDFFVVRLGTLDDDPGSATQRHIFVSDKASWYDIDAKIPQFPEWPE